jgi:hypothetical protein
MSVQHIKIVIPPRVAEPRGARWAALAAVALCNALRRASNALQRSASVPDVPVAVWRSKGSTRAESRPLVPHWGMWH